MTVWLAMYHVTEFLAKITTLLNPSLAAFIPSLGTIFNNGLFGLGKVKSRLKYLRMFIAQRLLGHVINYEFLLLLTKNFKSTIFKVWKKT